MSAADDPFAEGHEPHENHERYLITYADMITLLMALFIILFAIGQVDLEKYKRFQQGLADDFGAPFELGDGSGSAPQAVSLGANPRGGGELATNDVAGTKVEGGPATAQGLATALESEIESTWPAEGPDVVVRAEPGGVVVTLEIDQFVFAPGSAELGEQGAAVVDRIAPLVAGLTNDLEIEGHTDSEPLRGPESNWELSADRASAVVRRLADHGVAPQRMAAVGRADTQPVASNATAEGRAHNRRIEIFIVLEDPDAPAASEVSPVDLGSEAFADVQLPSAPIHR